MALINTQASNRDSIDSTTRQYNSSLRRFIEWGGMLPCDTDTVLDFIHDMGSLNRVERLTSSSLTAYCSAIKRWHEEKKFDDPTTDRSIGRALTRLASLERQNGIRKDTSRFITPEEGFQIISLLAVMNDSDKAKLERLVGAIALMAGHRSGMIASIQVDDMMNLGVANANIVINTPAFKTSVEDPTIIPYTGGEFCPATWIREHVQTHNLSSGYLFRSSQSQSGHITRHTVNDIAKRLFKMAGIVGGKLTATSFRKSMATLAAMEGVDAMAIAAQGSWANVDTIRKHYVGKAMALMGHAPLGLLKCIGKANNAIEHELKLLGSASPTLPANQLEILESFEEMRRGYWDILFHTHLAIEEKRGFASYFKTADKQVVKYGGESLMPQFKATCEDCGYQILSSLRD